MPEQLRKRFRLRVFYQRLALLSVLLVLLIWSSAFLSLHQEKKAADATANQTMLMVFRGAETRASDVFHDAFEYIHLAQAADRLGVPFGALYETMSIEKEKVDAVDYVMLFDSSGRILYSSTPLAALPTELKNLAPSAGLLYVSAKSVLKGDEQIFYIIGTNPSGSRTAVAINCNDFAEYVRPAFRPELLQLSLVDDAGRFFCQMNVDAAQLSALSAFRRADNGVAWERMPDGQVILTCEENLTAAPFALRLAWPETMMLQRYYAHRDQLLVTCVLVSVLLLMMIIFAGKMVKVRVESTRRLKEEKERFQQLVENLREVFFVREADSARVLYISPSVQNLWPDFDGDLDKAWEHFFTRVIPEDRVKVAAMQQHLLQPGGMADLEYRMQGVNGDIRWVWGRATRLSRAPEPDWIVGVIEDITDRKRLEQALSKMAKTDPLTSLANRAQFFEHGELERYRANRYGHSLTVLMIDIDYFKQVNDTYGHAVGDQVLVMVTRHCSQLLRPTDMMARIGGEEFAVVLSETNLEQACALAERLRVETAQQQVLFEGRNVFVTISIGVAQLRADDSTFDAVLRRADDALYQAKREGRNRVATAAE